MDQHSRRRLTRRLWTLIAIVAGVDFVFGAGFVYQMQHAGVSAGMVGGLIAMATLASTVLEVPSGAWGDRYGQRRVLVAGIALWGLGLGVFGLAHTVAWFAVGLALWGVGMSLYSGAPTALAVNQLRAAGAAVHVAAVMRGAQVVRWVAAAAGAATVVVAGGQLASRWLIVLGGAALCAAALWVHLRWAESSIATGGGGVLATLARGVRGALSGPVREVMVLGALAASALAVMLIAWQPVAGAHSVPVRGFGVVLLVFTVAVAVGASASRLLGAAPGPLAIAATLAAMTACLLFAGASDGRLGAGVGFVGAEFCSGVAGTLVIVRAQTVFADELRNTLTSLMSAVQGTVMAVTEAAYGVLWQAVGPEQALAYGSAALTVCLVVLTAAYALGALVRRPQESVAGAGD